MIRQERKRMSSDPGQERLRLLNTTEHLGVKVVGRPKEDVEIKDRRFEGCVNADSAYR